jgi:protein-disulfide isomerase
MKPSYFLLATAAVLASGACNAEKSGGTAAGNVAAEEAVKPPANGDWSTVVAQTAQGGFRMGNPDAKVKLVEFGSMTCPHCAEFDEAGFKPLIDKYVKNGQVSFEFRNFVRDPFDIAASLIARCNGSKSFFPLTSALFEDQTEWIGKIQNLPQAEMEALTNVGPDRQFLEIAKAAGLQQWAAMRGVPNAKSTQCLSDQNAVSQLVQMNSDATTQYPNFSGTPSFTINGELVERTASWQLLEPKLREALGS